MRTGLAKALLSVPSYSYYVYSSFFSLFLRNLVEGMGFGMVTCYLKTIFFHSQKFRIRFIAIPSNISTFTYLYDSYVFMPSYGIAFLFLCFSNSVVEMAFCSPGALCIVMKS